MKASKDKSSVLTLRQQDLLKLIAEHGTARPLDYFALANLMWANKKKHGVLSKSCSGLRGVVAKMLWKLRERGYVRERAFAFGFRGCELTERGKAMVAFVKGQEGKTKR